MKIVITESQLKLLVEDTECPCDDGTYSVDCCENDVFQIQPYHSDSLNTIKYALDSGIDLKDMASDVRYRQTWKNLDIPLSNLKDVLPDEYTTYVPELVSGVKPGFKFDNRLIDILSEIESISGVELKITGGRDYYHTKKSVGSKHNIGKAVDFVPMNGMTNANDSKVEWAVLDIILSGKYGAGIGFINEKVYESAAKTGPHFHLSLDEGNVEYSNFAFVDKDGNKYSKTVGNKGVDKSKKNLSWRNGGPIPSTINYKIKINELTSELKGLDLKSYCIKIVNLDDESISILTPEILPRRITKEKVKQYCSLIANPIEPRPINTNIVYPTLPVDIQVPRDAALYNQYSGLSKKELKKELRVADKGDLELIRTLKNLISLL